jgi:cytochrome c biogenesis protein CcmG/thiol:disulfide interchange protein DsbE
MTRRSLYALIPLVLFGALVLALYDGLSLNPKEIPSVLIERPVPGFDLPALDSGAPHLTSDGLKDGRVSVINVFASWCAPCRTEMPLLAELAKDPDLRLIGLVYKDAPAQTRLFLKDYGNPFGLIGVDASGRTGIDFGVYGVPETYVIDGAGVIAFKHIGPITPESLNQKLKPAIVAARTRTQAPRP